MVQAVDDDGGLAQGTVFSAIVAEDFTSESTIRVQFQMAANPNPNPNRTQKLSRPFGIN